MADYLFDEPLVLLAEDGGHFGEPDRGIASSRIEIAVPPLAEQRRVVAIRDDLTQSIFRDMFVRGGSDDWPLMTVEQIAVPTKGSIRTGPFGSQLLHGEFVDEGVAVLGIDSCRGTESSPAISSSRSWGPVVGALLYPMT